MSADNWAICPRCAKVEIDAYKKYDQKVKESYGKIPADDYLEMVSKNVPPVFVNRNLREDYEIGTDEYGEFCINYYCFCSLCEFSYEFNLSKNLDL